MYRTKPKLSVSIAATQRPSLSLSIKSPGPLQQVHSPRSPHPSSPAPSKRFSTLQVPTSTPSYVNTCSAKSILKKPTATGPSGATNKKIQFQGSPTVHCITPIENTDEYYGSYRKLSKEERRWIVRE
ncbi:hypothetical protein BDW67DRAFT_159111 [Aspergillus spinulosporus]